MTADREETSLEAMLAHAVKCRRLSRSDATLIRQDVARTLKDQIANTRELTTPDGKTLLLHVEPTEAGGILIVTEDISERKQIQQKIETMARTDPLTGMANRHELDRMLASIGPGFREGIGSVAILYIDRHTLDLSRAGVHTANLDPRTCKILRVLQHRCEDRESYRGCDDTEQPVPQLERPLRQTLRIDEVGQSARTVPRFGCGLGFIGMVLRRGKIHEGLS